MLYGMTARARGRAGLALLLAAGGLGALTLPGGTPARAADDGCPAPPSGEARPWLNPGYSDDCRARFVVAAIDGTGAKIDAIASNDTFTSMGITMPAGNDGPAGDVRGGGATQFPAPITLGATWSTDLAARYGDAIGEEYRARGKSEVGGPVVDLTRTWHQGRQAEGLGEDPYLTSALVSYEVPAIQANHVVAMTKHLAVYNQETGRAGDAPTTSGPTSPPNFANDEIVSNKALQEVWMAPFGASAAAGTGMFMCAFPSINGTYACDNSYIMNTMRDQYGFRGSIGPDFPNAQRSVAQAAKAGLDNGNWGTNGAALAQAVNDGEVPVATLDRIIYDKVIAAIKVGLVDHPPAVAATDTADVRSPAHDRVSEDVATEGAVLLKDKASVLPLRKDLHSIAVIGAGASAAPVYDVGGSAYVPPVAAGLVSPLKGIQDRAPNGVTINYAQGSAPVGQQPDTPELPLLSTSLTATYYGTPDWSGAPVATRTETGANLNEQTPIPAVAQNTTTGIKVNGWSVRYTGSFTAASTGTYVFSLGDGGSATLYVNGIPKIHNLDGQFGYADQVAMSFTAGQTVNLRVDYTPREAAPGILPPNGGALTVAPTIKIGPYLHLGMAGPDTATSGTVAAPDALIAGAVTAARASDVAVVFVTEASGEGVDRNTLSLPGAQDQLVDAVARANPDTIVVVNSGGPVLMPWLTSVKGVLDVWYPGQQYGRSVADLLFGDATPDGRLPMTFPASEDQGPGATTASFPGVSGPSSWTETFDEGVLTGHRYYDAHDQKPLFPFGYGLSYTSFAYGPLSLSAPDASRARTATVRITNTGSADGAEVPQLYLSHPAAAGEAPWELKGFAKVHLAPGASQDVTFTIDDRTLRTWNEGRQAWEVLPGTYAVAVGRSSRDFEGQASFAVAGAQPAPAGTDVPVPTPAQVAQATQAPKPPPAPARRTKAPGRVSGTFSVSAQRGTKVIRLKATGLAKGSKVAVSCSGKGCGPSARSTAVVRHGVANLASTKAVKGKRLRPGARLKVTITATGHTARTITVTIRQAAQPKIG